MKYLDLEKLEALAERELPIKSGNGETPATAYALEGIDQFLSPSLERMIVELTMKNAGMEKWMMKRQICKTIDDKKMDVMEFLGTKNEESKVYNFYFDLSYTE